MRKRTAYRLVTPRLVARCWNPSDAPLLHRAVLESQEHLRPWMPWVGRRPQTLEARIQRLRTFRARFDLDQDWIYGVFDPCETRVLGGTGFHPRSGNGSLELGYWIHVDHVNRGLATELSAALVKVAFEVMRATRVDICCDPANTASAAVPRKLGFRHEATLRARLQDPEGKPRDKMVWSLLPEEYPQSPSARSPVRAYDAVGRTIRLGSK